MTNYFIYAKDYSGSTCGSEHYHTNGLKTLEEFKKGVQKINEELSIDKENQTESKIVYLHWDSNCWEVSEEETSTSYLNRRGNGGTYPEAIISFLKKNYKLDANDKIKLVYIITDGEIGDASASKCFELNDDMQYENVVFHAFNKRLESIDLSVAASFFKSRCLVYRNYEVSENTDISQEFDYDKITVDNFASDKEEMRSYIRLKYINKSRTQNAVALREIEKLKKLRGRLFDELSLRKGNSGKGSLETKDKEAFLQGFKDLDWYKNLYATEYEIKVDIEKSISTLINYIVSDARSYSFNALKFDTNYSKKVVEEEIVDVDFKPEQEIEFPDIILDDEKGVPVIILTKLDLMDKIIFHGQKQQPTEEVPTASFSKFKSTMECPLFLVKDQDISESIGYFYNLNAFKLLVENNSMQEPRTRRPFHGGLVLTDTKEFDKYNDYILSATYFNGKKVKYNVGLFYYVLWKNCENKEWMDKNVVEMFKKYTMRRISETRCNIGLSSLPLDPQVKTSLLSALWYCVELSSYIFRNDPQEFKQERLRYYHGVARYMVEILKYFNYDLDLKFIEKRKELISYVMKLKTINPHKEKVYCLLKEIFKTVDGFLVNEIEKPYNLNKLNYLKPDHKGMLADDVVDGKVHLNDYVHLMHFEDDSPFNGTKDYVQISEKTFRPFFGIDQDRSFYTEMVKMTKKVVINNDDDKNQISVSFEAIDVLTFDKVLSLYKLFLNCVMDLEKYPTLPEYTEFISKKKKFNEDLVTIFPPNVHMSVKEVYNQYQEIVSKVEVKEFIEVCKAYVNRANRIKGEDRLKFSSDEEINQFISAEELKVNLKKNTS